MQTEENTPGSTPEKKEKNIKSLFKRYLENFEAKVEAEKAKTEQQIQNEKLKALYQSSAINNNLVPPGIPGNVYPGTAAVGAIQISNNQAYVNTGARNVLISSGVASSMWSTYPSSYKPDIFSLYTNDNKTRVVHITQDGEVVWGDGFGETESAKLFSRVIKLGAEEAANMTYSVKQNIRDAVFAEMIAIAEEKGSITAEDLTYLQKAAKIMDKLKGIK